MAHFHVESRMELTVLADNNTLTDRYLLGEPGLALHLRLPEGDFLLDCGYSDVTRVNAGRLGLDLTRLHTIVLSHGHLDHTWGLPHLLALHAEHTAGGGTLPRPRLVAHPEALTPRFFEGEPIGNLLSRDILADHFELVLSREPLALTDRLVFLGEIPRRPGLVTPGPVGERRSPDGLVPDTLPDDTALAYRGTDGLVIITGCSHAGIANIVEQARDVTGEGRLTAIIGGLHLLGPAPDGLDATVDYLAGTGVTALFPCHCTGLAAKIALNRAAPVFEVGAGSRFVWD